MKKSFFLAIAFLGIILSGTKAFSQCDAFTGLNLTYCTSSPPSTLVPTNLGGTFSGPGVTGTIFNPGAAGPGTHIITHTISVPGCMNQTYDLSTTVTADPIVNAGPDDTICSGQSVTLNGTQTGAITYYWSPTQGLNNANILNPIASPTVTTTYTLTGLTAGGVAGSDKVYMRSTAGQPWGQTTNEQAMNAVFGVGGWLDLRYETAPAATVFLPTTRFVFMEGGDFIADEMENYLNANIGTIEAWVASGGSLLVNGAPNEGNGMAYGFGGTQLNYFLYCSNVNGVIPAHPIFNGPYLPCGTVFTGNYFYHAWVTGIGLTNLIDGCGFTGLAEKTWGSGNVMFGGMTTTNWQGPAPNAMNLRQNILYYMNDIANGGACIDQDQVTITVLPPLTIAPTATPDQSCAGLPVLLNANVGNGNCDDYTISTIPFNPAPPAATTPVFLGDDQVTPGIPLPFPFNFYCTNYNTVYISSNGFIGFDPLMPNGCCSGIAIPNANTPNLFIAANWNDLYPPGGGTIEYYTNGLPPNRIFVVKYTNIPHYPNFGGQLNSFTIQLYETTNAIEIHLMEVTADGSNATLGIEDGTGANGIFAAGKNGTPWTSIMEAFLIEPVPPAPYTLTWQAPLGNTIGTGDTLTVTPGGNTTYYAIISNGLCSAQGQVTVPVTTVDAGPDVFLCPGGDVNFNATFFGPPPPNQCDVYTVTSIPFGSIPGGGTAVILGDDQMSLALPIGFSFQFYCNNYTQFYISSNGFIEFTGFGNSGCCGGQFLPNASTPNNLIAAAWDDLYPPGNGSVNYFTIGAPPNRRLVVNWSGIPYCCGVVPEVTTQIILYETSNIIEVHSASINSINPGTQGIENNPGALAVTSPGRNASFWSALSDAYRWTPQVGTLVWNWTPPTYLNQTNIPNPTGVGIGGTITYYVTVDNGSCIVTDSVTVTVCLPVDNVLLTGQQVGEDVGLDWNSFNEIQLSHYILERSVAGSGWQDLGRVNATGGEGLSADYSFMDNNPGSGTNYYRLRLVNENGSIEYSNQVEVTFGNGEFVKVSPNPGKGIFNFEIGLMEDSNLSMEIYNTEAKVVYNKNQGILLKGISTVQVDISSLSDGVYYYYVTGNEGSHAGKLVIKR